MESNKYETILDFLASRAGYLDRNRHDDCELTWDKVIFLMELRERDLAALLESSSASLKEENERLKSLWGQERDVAIRNSNAANQLIARGIEDNKRLQSQVETLRKALKMADDAISEISDVISYVGTFEINVSDEKVARMDSMSSAAAVAVDKYRSFKKNALTQTEPKS